MRTAFSPGPTVRINCPKCKAKAVPSETYQQEEVAYGVSHTTNWVKCGHCKKKLLSKRPIEELPRLTPAQLEAIVIDRNALLTYFNLAAMTFCWVPFIGLALTGAALYLNKRQTTWWWVCLAGLVIGLVMTVYIGKMMFGPEPSIHRSH